MNKVIVVHRTLTIMGRFRGISLTVVFLTGESGCLSLSVFKY